ncbi:acyl-CoA dehydrogenase family protein [Nocardioides sp.]|uniref:acyl-CoA dehydrogenase family protein n=1 Tax=Nocardioides sp. TaxID=35761 RepID=UPI0031FE708A|nr:acyl-CoA dehydrogenase [Nocardioides sp.]
MITEPLTTADELEIRDVVVDFTRTTFTSERVRAAALTPRGYDEVAWKQMVDLGWTGLGIAEDVGGAGLGAIVQCLVHRELGARLAPTPFLGSAGFGAAALDVLVDDDEAAHGLLAAVVDGTVQCALALGHGRGWPGHESPSITAQPVDDGWTVTGSAALVLDAARADVVLVVAALEEGGWRLFQVAASATTPTPVPLLTVDVTRTYADLLFDHTPATPIGASSVTSDRVSLLVDQIAVYLAAEMVGVAIACTNQTLDYLRTRHQFGKPLGSFQALKHRCADVAVAVTVAQELVFSAATLIEADDFTSLALAAPLALARAGEVMLHATQEAIQLHGGVGFTDEVDIGLYYKRALGDLELIASPVDAYARMDLVRTGKTS